MNNYVITNLAASLASKGKSLQLTNGSLLHQTWKDDFYPSIGQKLLTEVTMFKNELYPSLKFFKDSIKSSLTEIKPDGVLIGHKDFSMTPVFETIQAVSGITELGKQYIPMTIGSHYGITLDLETIENPIKLFCDESVKGTLIAKTLLEGKTNEEIKSFVSEYCLFFYNEGIEETMLGRKNYRTFGESGIKAMINMDKLSLLWCFAQMRKAKMGPGVLSHPVHNENLVIENVIRDIENIIQLGMGVYNDMVKKKIVCFDDPYTDNEDYKYIYVMQDVLPELIERSSQDPWTAMFGSHYSIVKYYDENAKGLRTVDDIINHETEYIRYYNKLQEFTNIKVREQMIQMVRKKLMVVARETYENFVVEDKKQYTSSDNLVKFLDKVEPYISTISDKDCIENLDKVSIDIISGLLYDKTNFKMFLNAQEETSDIISKFEIEDEQEVIVWIMNFLVTFLVNSVETN